MTTYRDVLQTVAARPGVTCRAVVAAVHRCPYADDRDEGTLTIEWATNGVTIELHSLREYVDCYRDDPLSHEALVASVREDLFDAGVSAGLVTWRGETAQIDYTATTGRGSSDAVLLQPVNPEGA